MNEKLLQTDILEVNKTLKTDFQKVINTKMASFALAVSMVLSAMPKNTYGAQNKVSTRENAFLQGELGDSLQAGKTAATSLNLVSNSGFEEYVECPDDYPGNGDVHLAEPWIGFSADYMHECAGQDPFYVEQNEYNSPRSGDAYVRIATYLTNSDNYREYIEVPLTEALEVGEYYCVEYYCKLYSIAGIGTDGMGAFFTEGEAEYNEFVIFEEGVGNQIIAEAQILSPIIHSDTLNYTQVFGTFVADRPYTHVTFGNFVNDNKLETENVLNPLPEWGGGSSYAIDDVSVHKCGVLVEEYEKLPNVYASVNTLHIKYLDEDLDVKIYNLQGQLVAQQEFGDNTVYDVSFLPAGVYVYHVFGKNGTREGGKLICD